MHTGGGQLSDYQRLRPKTNHHTLTTLTALNGPNALNAPNGLNALNALNASNALNALKALPPLRALTQPLKVVKANAVIPSAQ